jgi:hypothetical protein
MLKTEGGCNHFTPDLWGVICLGQVLGQGFIAIQVKRISAEPTGMATRPSVQLAPIHVGGLIAYRQILDEGFVAPKLFPPSPTNDHIHKCQHNSDNDPTLTLEFVSR